MPHRDPRIPYALMDGDPLPANMGRRAEEELRRWKEMDRQSAEITSEIGRLEMEQDRIFREQRAIENEWADIWRELGLPYP